MASRRCSGWRASRGSGRLGVWGGSAFGHTQWALADQSRPGPTALMIQIASTSFREMFHPGGAFSLESALFWAARSGGPADAGPYWALGSRCTHVALATR